MQENNNVVLPPSSPDAESATLGSILIDPDSYYEIEQIICCDSEFYVEKNRVVWRAMQQLVVRGDPIDMVGLSDAIVKTGSDVLEDPMIYLIDLLNTVPTSVNASSYAKIVHEKFKRRQIIQMASSIAAIAYSSEDDISKIVDDVQAAALALSDVDQDDVKQSPQYVDEAIELIENARKTGLHGLSTGFDEFDKLLGGLSTGLHVIAAVDKSGKSTLAWQIASNLADRGHCVAGFLVEMKAAEVSARTISARSSIPHRKMMAGNVSADEMEIITKWGSYMKKWKFPIYERRNVTPSQIRAILRRQQVRYGRVDLVVVDNFQIMSPSIPTKNVYGGLDAISAELTQIAGDFDVPVVLVAQINSKAIENRGTKRPTPQLLHGSTAPAKDCTTFSTIYDHSRYEDQIGEDLTIPYNHVEIVTHMGRNTQGGSTYAPKEFKFRRFGEQWKSTVIND